MGALPGYNCATVAWILPGSAGEAIQVYCGHSTDEADVVPVGDTVPAVRRVRRPRGHAGVGRAVQVRRAGATVHSDLYRHPGRDVKGQRVGAAGLRDLDIALRLGKPRLGRADPAGQDDPGDRSAAQVQLRRVGPARDAYLPGDLGAEQHLELP